MKEQIKDTQRRSATPNGADVDEGKDDGPEQRKWDGKNGCDETIHPEASHVEDEESQTPDEFETVSRIWFSNDVLELDIDMIIDSLLVSIQHIQSHCEVLSASI